MSFLSSSSSHDEDEGSVHLQLETMHRSNSEDEEEEEHDTKKSRRRTSTLLSYTDPKSKTTWTGLNISLRRFEAWLHYTLEQLDPDEHAALDERRICREELEISTKDREGLRDKWNKGHLLCDRTELLTVYQSDKSSFNGEEPRETRSKRGGFGDLLHLYADRFYGILQDEREDPPDELKDWLFAEYGQKESRRLTARSFRRQHEDEQFRILQHFLDWFRSQFPYYYDKCNACGASYKDEPDHDNSDVMEADDDGSTFLGYIVPSANEREGKAGRTELYQCHQCQVVTRFPRFNKVSAVLSQKRGRCGEYSMLLYRMLRSMGHEARWIVDWADHVWAEILLPSTKEWIHLDPCEAAVNQPHLYQDWGKQQTYIVGFYPASNNRRFPAIEDLTSKYTSDDMETIESRREESTDEFDQALSRMERQLRQKILDSSRTGE